MVLLPVLSHTLELAVHFARGTPELSRSIARVGGVHRAVHRRSTCSPCGAARSWSAPGCGSLADDLRRTPRLIGAFVARRDSRDGDALPPSEAPVTTVHITNAYHPSSGGIRTFYHALLAAAPHHGRHVRLVVPGDRDAVEDVNPFAAHLHRPRAPLAGRRSAATG